MSLQIPQKRPFWHQLRMVTLWLVLAIFLCWLMLYSWQKLVQNQQPALNVAVVDIGPVLEFVAGQGRLLPRYNHSVMAEVDGVIQTLHLYPGSAVKQGDLLISMRNPLLDREKERAELAVLEAQAAMEAATARLEREKITLENEVAMLEAEIRFAEQEMHTLQTLLQQQIIARLDYLRVQTKLEQSKLKHTLSQRNLSAFQQARQADENAHHYRLLEAQKQLAMTEYDIQQLHIRADSTGLLNELSEQIEVGKPIRRADIVAQITDPSTLYADILIAASEVNKVHPGQQVQVQIRQQQMQGQVIRVHPSVQHNQVRVEVQLPEMLPDNARTNLDISARIIIAESQQALRVTPVLGIRQGQTALNVFVKHGEYFQQRQITIGSRSQDYMEILDGLKVGEQLLLDPPSHLQSQEQISLKELTRG